MIHVVLFAYDRPQELKKTVESLVTARRQVSVDTHLTVFCDYPDNSNAQVVESYLKSVVLPDFQSFEVKFSSFKKGLRRSVLEGVTHVALKYEVAPEQPLLLILEDDIVLKREAFRFILKQSDHLTFNKNVFSLGLYLSCKELLIGLGSFSALNTCRSRFDCWGWCVNPTAWLGFVRTSILEKLRTCELDIEELDKMPSRSLNRLKGIISGELDLWAAEVNAYCHWLGFQQIRPPVSLVENIGQLKNDQGFLVMLKTLINPRLHKILNFFLNTKSNFTRAVQ